jgi:DNA replication and repair protein RecF
MNVRCLTIKNFRNYSNCKIEFSDKINVIVGNNGTGKTNILEAISVVSNIKSFRSIPDNAMIKWGETAYHCRIDAYSDREISFEVGCAFDDSRTVKKAKIDGVNIEKFAEYIGKFPTVVFSPSDVLIISDSPDCRRRYIDAILSRTNAAYYQALIDFRKVLSARNRTLKMGKARGRIDKNELSAWDAVFSRYASLIIEGRGNFLETYHPLFMESYAMISGDDVAPSIDYIPSIPGNDTENITARLNASLDKDIVYGTTTIGPHRDDFVFTGEMGVLFNNYASQGQKRTAAIALKCAEGIYIDRITGNKAVIMVDDVFSELDEKRRRNLLALLNRGNQVIFTMVYPERLDFGSLSSCAFYSTNGEGAVKLL